MKTTINLLDVEEMAQKQQTTFFREVWPDWCGSDPRLVEVICDEEGWAVPGCYRTKPAPTYE